MHLLDNKVFKNGELNFTAVFVSMLTYVTKLISFSAKTTLNMRVSCNCKGVTDRILVGVMLVQETV